ncbi:hypothetical protein Tco_0925974 [Tanacetum coccineum]|uniref:Uncharacterized protein n=1 Tax=Tanacetum coccineum TaxID=301880 RepID=A0ABQ5D8F6_9ASTR
MFNDKDFEEIDDYMENVEEETVDDATTRVSTIVSVPVSTVGVTISTAEPRTPPQQQTVSLMMRSVLIEEEPVKIKIRDQGDLKVQADTTLAQRLHEEELAELEKAQQKRQRQEDDTNAALAKEFDEIQARIDLIMIMAIKGL